MRSRTASAAVLLLATAWGSPAFSAESGADYLLRSVGGGKGDGKEQPAFERFSGFRLDTPFMLQLFAAWQDEKTLPYEVQSWVRAILNREYEGAAHLWSVVEPKIPESFHDTAQAAWAYLLWKLDLPQSFLDTWLRLLARPDFVSSRISRALLHELEPGFEPWLLKNALHFTPDQEATVQSLKSTEHAVLLSLHAAADRRRGDRALGLLTLLPANSPLKIELSRTVALALARKGDLAGAAKVLRHHLEPAVQARRDPGELAEHYLHIARLLYQAGALDGARLYYEKIPNGVPQYVRAREELIWTLLRENDSQRLRGELATLGSPAFKGRFNPELPLVQAISNLKLCYYAEVEKDLKGFVEHNRGWASRVDAALKASEAPAPPERDAYAVAADQAALARRQEVARLQELGERSVAAIVPAVGVQAHWVRLRDQCGAREQLALKARDREYRRQWANLGGELREAIRKFSFVKVELLSQLRDLRREALAETGGDRLVLSQAAPVAAKPLEKSDGQIVFPVDDVLWADELFKLRSVAQARCLKRGS